MDIEVFESGENGDVVFIEELDGRDLPESELAQFEETQPLQAIEICDSTDEEESMDVDPGDEIELQFALLNTDEQLLNKIVSGEGELSDIFRNSAAYEDDDDDDDEEDDAESAAEKLSQSRRNGSGKRKNLSAHEDRQGGGSDIVRSKRSTLTDTQKAMMGQANIALANQEPETARLICNEVIRQNRRASEPYFTLANIYEATDIDKYILYLTFAAHLDSHNRELWIQLADMHVERGDLVTALKYYTTASKVLNKDWSLRYRKAQLTEQLGNITLAMRLYHKLLPMIPLEEASVCLYLTKRVTHYFEENGKRGLALDAMDSTYRRFRTHFTNADLNLYLELLLLSKNYKQIVCCLNEHTSLNLDVDGDNGDDELATIYFCELPATLLPTFRAKLCVALIKLRMHHLLCYLIDNVHQHMPPTGENIDHYMDITEALMQEHKYEEAIKLMIVIVECEDCPAFVWLRHAECLQQLNRTSEAIESYYRVVRLAPCCYEAKFTLSSLLKQQGYYMEAVNALEQANEDEAEGLHARLLYERCLLLHDVGRHAEFIEAGYKLLSRHSLLLKNREEMLAAASGGSVYNVTSVKSIIQQRSLLDGEPGNDRERFLQAQKVAPDDESELKIDDEYKLYVKLQNTAHRLCQYESLHRLSFAMITTKRFMKYKSEIEQAMVLACYFNQDWPNMFSFLRERINKDSANVGLWNLLGLLWQADNDIRYQRYLRRLIERRPEVQPLRMFLGHFHLQCCSYKYALKNYKPIYELTNDPLAALCMAVVFIQMSTQKRVYRKSAASAQAIAMANLYATMRAGDQCGAVPTQQEIYYNLGRFYHQAGLLHIAAENYERALTCQHSLIAENKACLSLQEETAFNLHLIYKASGNLDKARDILYEHVTL